MAAPAFHQPQTAAGFDYSQLPPADAETLRRTAARIHAKIALTHQLIVEIGQDLIAMKERFGPSGVFMAWCDYEFDVSHQTLNNWMSVARRVPTLPAGSEQRIAASALYEAAKQSADGEGVKVMIDLLQQGRQVDYKTGYILTRAPAHIRDRYLTEDEKQLTREAAFGLAKAYNSSAIPQAVKARAAGWGVSDARVLEAMSEAHNRHEATRHHAQPSLSWSTLVDDDGQLNGIGWSKPVGTATPEDWERWQQDRQRIHLDSAAERYDWKEADATIAAVDGRPALVLLTPAEDLLQRNGETAWVKIRLKSQAQS